MNNSLLLNGVLYDYVRLCLYPLAMLGFTLLIANEKTGNKDWYRIATLLGPVILLGYLLVMNLLTLAGTDIDDIATIRDYTLTPIITYMVISVWIYISRKMKM
jgi:hypothetical protein